VTSFFTARRASFAFWRNRGRVRKRGGRLIVKRRKCKNETPRVRQLLKNQYNSPGPTHLTEKIRKKRRDICSQKGYKGGKELGVC